MVRMKIFIRYFELKAREYNMTGLYIKLKLLYRPNTPI